MNKKQKAFFSVCNWCAALLPAFALRIAIRFVQGLHKLLDQWSASVERRKVRYRNELVERAGEIENVGRRVTARQRLVNQRPELKYSPLFRASALISELRTTSACLGDVVRVTELVTEYYILSAAIAGHRYACTRVVVHSRAVHDRNLAFRSLLHGHSAEIVIPGSLLVVIAPRSGAVSGLGDFHEEFNLRRSSTGVVAAQRWAMRYALWSARQWTWEWIKRVKLVYVAGAWVFEHFFRRKH